MRASFLLICLFGSGHGFLPHFSRLGLPSISSRPRPWNVRALRSYQLREVRARPVTMQANGNAVAATEPSCHLRSWRPEDHNHVCELILRTQGNLQGLPAGFNCEGPLDTDCGSVELTQSSYVDVEENSFLVAVSESGMVVATGALTVGTAISTLKSGASMSVPSMGAIRRVCIDHTILTDRKTRENVMCALLDRLELDAEDAGCKQLIALGYPESCATLQPTPSVLSRRGFHEIGKLTDTPVSQFSLDLPKPRSQAAPAEDRVQSNPAGGAAARAFSLLVGRGSGVVIVCSLVLILAGALGVAGLLGLDVSMGSGEGNRGAGTPLSVEEVRQMMQDEKLQMKTLEEGEETVEGAREEEALMRVIMGGEIRVK